MKSLISIIASVYLFFNLGMGMSAHYCMGFLQEVSFGHESHKCCCGELEMSDDCCEDIHTNLSLDEDQLQSRENINTGTEFFLIKDLAFDLSDDFIPKENLRSYSKSKDPPLRKSISRIFIQSLVLYA